MPVHQMMEPKDVDEDGKALAESNHKWWDVLPEFLDHAVDEELSTSIQDWKNGNIDEKALVVSHEVNDEG